jgi:hypothetical protein
MRCRERPHKYKCRCQATRQGARKETWSKPHKGRALNYKGRALHSDCDQKGSIVAARTHRRNELPETILIMSMPASLSVFNRKMLQNQSRCRLCVPERANRGPFQNASRCLIVALFSCGHTSRAVGISVAASGPVNSLRRQE